MKRLKLKEKQLSTTIMDTAEIAATKHSHMMEILI